MDLGGKIEDRPAFRKDDGIVDDCGPFGESAIYVESSSNPAKTTALKNSQDSQSVISRAWIPVAPRWHLVPAMGQQSRP